eukprot:TRINITY_DN5614_c0_g1_i2.p1 TRINITY_DN5614_c0_g1~~TRINITY_DN5614_c0_g1_i2.p1  ORF type:complete len:285 (-),score=20.81 TRINITY_DN5614_c0_g1_i2:107-961(-)
MQVAVTPSLNIYCTCFWVDRYRCNLFLQICFLKKKKKPMIIVGGNQGEVVIYRFKKESMDDDMDMGDNDDILQEVGSFKILSGRFEILCLQADQVENRVYIGLGNGMIQAWDLGLQQQVYMNQAHSLPVSGLDCSTDTNRIVTGSADGWIKVWDVREPTVKEIRSRQSTSPITCAKFDQQGNWVIYGNEDDELIQYSVLCDKISQQTKVQCTPLDLSIQPSEILVVGTCQKLLRYNFLGDKLYDDPLKIQLAYGVDVDSSKKMIGVCGVRGVFDVLSPSGTYYV